MEEAMLKENDNKVVPSDFEDDKSESVKGVNGDDDNKHLPLTVLVLLFIEKFLEVVIIILFTLLAILWKFVHNLLLGLFWPLVICAILSIIGLIVLCRIPWFQKSPGCFLYKHIYLHLVQEIFFILAIHVPPAFPILSPYFAIIGEGVIGATYLIFALISWKHKNICKSNAKGCILWLYAYLTPVFVLLLCQPLYFAFNYNYTDYICNVGIGIATSLPFVYEPIYIYRIFTQSNDLSGFMKTKGIMPSFVTTYYEKQERGKNEEEKPVVLQL